MPSTPSLPPVNEQSFREAHDALRYSDSLYADDRLPGFITYEPETVEDTQPTVQCPLESFIAGCAVGLFVAAAICKLIGLTP